MQKWLLPDGTSVGSDDDLDDLRSALESVQSIRDDWDATALELETVIQERENAKA